MFLKEISNPHQFIWSKIQWKQ